MAIVNLKDKTIQIKIVYYGPGRSGKTTNLEYIHNKLQQNKKQKTSKLVSIDTKGDRTLFFDFFPVSLGKINGFDLKLKLYTTPGQVKYEATRRLVLKGVDGVVFVADSLASRQDANLESFENLKSNLQYHQQALSDIQLAFQWNKQDINEQMIPLASISDMERALNSELKVKAFPSSAVSGMNVIKTVNYISKQTVKSVIQKTILSRQKLAGK
ncbi:Mutual gliding-motility protein MglA [Desulfamplus magnetovallimortis]|uniref:Mutual gliding-motility protein MglA n=1 Tax=Desulfamplus magnetovallimortis TaxID=1246637 RepID=A0A1W1HCJ0_9BACT|nr:GTPase domain-containing protein [Desulfamplus magnetovallimortis]MBF0233403.1 GTPase domain-containing protein [Desulfamplus sp.]SLM30190.1 Mutual gliding-motility protein MglA [Desulfamplus magnetovallimortis]